MGTIDVLSPTPIADESFGNAKLLCIAKKKGSLVSNAIAEVRPGDFTDLAKSYVHRTGYCTHLLTALIRHVSGELGHCPRVAEVGAGTGKLTRQLLEMGLDVVAVEPNAAMREEGMHYTREFPVTWLEGQGEVVPLADSAVDWVVMASSFHWTDHTKSVPEFARVLGDHGLLTVMWNPRDLESSELHMGIEKMIHQMAPHIQRKSSGASAYTQQVPEQLLFNNHFRDILFMEAPHVEEMSLQRYMGAWKSVNDIPSQVGPHQWEKILDAIESEVQHLSTIDVPYRTRAWTVHRR